jgi:lipoprotein-releasing system permease protein
MHWPVELFLALRYLRPRRAFVSIITIFSFLGVAIGVWALIVVLSVMAGFQHEIAEKIVGFNAHITVGMANGAVLYDYDQLVDFVRKQPGVVAASPFVQGPVLVAHAGTMTPSIIKSVPEDGDDPVLPLKQYLKLGDWELRGDSVLIGEEWSKRNGVFPGDKLTVYGAAQVQSFLHRNDKNANVTIALPQEPIVRGVFKTGKYNYDLDFLLVSLEMAQEIWGMPNAVHGIQVRVADLDQAEPVKEALNKALPPTLHAHTWMDDNKDLFNQIVVERVVMAFILCLILMVAVFGLCSTLITTTVQKAREIGLMKALGASDPQVCAVFLLNGTIIGVGGTVLGLVIAFFTLHYLSAIRNLLLYSFHIQVFPNDVYGLPQIPAIVNPTQVVLIAVGSVLICMLAALIPAVSAARLAPARALRYE